MKERLLEIFSVFDVKAECYMQPFFCRNSGMALRLFTAAVNEEGTQFNLHAEDFSLWRVGEFEERTGKVGSVVPVQIAGAFELVERGIVPIQGGE